MKLTFVYTRHGETLFNVQNRACGRTDSPLTERGIRQVEGAARALERIHFDACYASPKGRAQKTAEILLKSHDMHAYTEEGLSEFDYGIWDGKVKDFSDPDFAERFAQDHFDDLGGENRDKIDARIRKTFAKIVSDRKDGDRILIVAHGAYYRHLLRALFGIVKPEEDAGGKPLIPNCGIAVFTYEDGKWDLVQNAVSPQEFRSAL